MTRRLLLSYLGLALLIVVLLEIPLAVVGTRYERDAATGQAQKVATGLAIAAADDFEKNRSVDLRNVVVHYRDATGGEVSIVDAGGFVVASADDDHDSDLADTAGMFARRALAGSPAAGLVSDEHAAVIVAAAPIGDAGLRSGAVVLLVSAHDTVERIHGLWAAMGGLAALIAMVALGAGRAMAGALSRPLRRLGSSVAMLGETNLSARAATDDGPVEVRALAGQFNAMATRLSALVEAQGNFVADASHQLRSPLTALRLRIENLEADLPGPPGVALAAIGEEVQRLSRLVDGLVSLGHADTDQAPRLAIDVRRAVEERCSAWAALAQERQVALEPPSGPAGEANATLVPGDLEQIMDNLLANALDASPPGSRISVSVVAPCASGLEIHIADQGPGMTDEQLERAFDRFWRASATAGSKGGLGLAIVRQLGVRNDLDVTLQRGAGGGLDAVIAIRGIIARPPKRGRGGVVFPGPDESRRTGQSCRSEQMPE